MIIPVNLYTCILIYLYTCIFEYLYSPTRPLFHKKSLGDILTMYIFFNWTGYGLVTKLFMHKITIAIYRVRFCDHHLIYTNFLTGLTWNVGVLKMTFYITLLSPHHSFGTGSGATKHILGYLCTSELVNL